jgi:hypothetical protein
VPPALDDVIERRTSGLVGRDPERLVLRQLLDDAQPLVALIHGIGGVGKSRLLESFLVEARERGTVAVLLDGGAIEPTVRGFLAGLSAATGDALPDVGGAVARLSALGKRVVLALDRYEHVRPLDPWLRQTFVPALDDNVRIVIAGRDPPVDAWPLEFGSLFRAILLENLGRDDALKLLRDEGVDGEEVERIYRIARGHPLSLRLAASALEASPSAGEDAEGDAEADATTVAAIIDELTQLYLRHLDLPTRRALDAASVVRRPTLSLLAAMLPEAAPQDAFDRLRRLPFVGLGIDGLVIHDTIREVVAANLRTADPTRSRAYRVAAWRRLREEVARASSVDTWRYTADLLYMLESPVLRADWFPTTERRFWVDEARPDDWPAILRFSLRQFPGASTSEVEAWWKYAPWSFRIARDAAGTAAGFSTVTELKRVPRRLVGWDPIDRAWRDHLVSRPIPTGQLVTAQRFERADPDDPFSEEVHAALALDLMRTWMELRPAIRRHYFVGRQAPHEWSGNLEVEPLPGSPVIVDGVSRYVAVLDFGSASVDGWLTRIIANELRVDDDSILDVARHQLVIENERVALSKLEFEVFKYLYERPGAVVERAALLRDVWGYDYAGGSNIIEALVASLRRKLGERAAAIETVRGVGYRFVASA